MPYGGEDSRLPIFFLHLAAAPLSGCKVGVWTD